MSSREEIVGKENLPNLYIKEISIDAASSGAFLVEVMVYLKDFKDEESRFQWYENETLRKNMKLMIVGSSSGGFNGAITKGNHNGSFSPQHLKRITGYSKQQVQYKFLSIMNLSKEYLTQEPSDGLYTFGYRCKFKIVGQPKNYSVFAACVLDVKQFALESNVDLDYLPINSFHGAVAGEKVFVGGNLVTNTNLFFKGGAVYAGPVHKRGTRWMEGSKHSSVQHSALTKRQIPNIKIKDYRIKYKKKPTPNKLLKSPIFSELYTSYDNNGSLKGSFHMNMRQFFIQNTQYGGLLLQLNADLFNSMLSKVRLNHLAIERESIIPRRIVSKSGTSKLVPRSVLGKTEIIRTHDHRPYRLRSRYKYYDVLHGRNNLTFAKSKSKSTSLRLYGSIQELHEDDSLVLRAFNFSDLSISRKFGGLYRYKVTAEIQDPTSKFVLEMMKELKTGITQFGLYKRKLERRVNYDYLLNKTKEDFIAKQMRLDHWVNSVNIYLKYYDLMFDANEEEMEKLTNQVISLINPRTATVKSLGRFFFHYQLIFDYMMKLFGKTDKIFNEANSRGSVKSGNPDLGKIRFDHEWPDLHNFRKNKCRVSFLPEGKMINKQQDRFPMIYRGEFQKMVREERNKYFKSAPAFSMDTIPFVKPEHISALNDIKKSSYTYFSPNRLFWEDVKFDLSNMGTVDLYDFNMFYSNFIGRGPSYANRVNSIQRSNERRAKEVLNRARSSYYIRKRRAQREHDKRHHKEGIEIAKQLGKDSGMAASQKPNAKIGNNVLDRKVKNAFGAFESSKTSREVKTRNSFTLDGRESILTAIFKEKKFNLDRLVWIPQQIKSLFASRYSFSKSNILKSNYDLLVNPFTRDYVDLLFFTIGKIEYLAGYKKTSDGSEDIRHPIWRIMTPDAYRANNRVLLCRISLFSDSALKLKEKNYDSFNIENQYFYIYGKHEVDRLTEDSPLLENRQAGMRDILKRQEDAAAHPVEYSQSIIVSQHESKNGPLKNVDYGVGQAQLQDNNDFNKQVGEVDNKTGGLVIPKAKPPTRGNY